MAGLQRALARIGPYYAFAVASGAAGLGYELLWTRMLAISLGHEITAVLSVVAAFFAGLALGGVCLGAAIRRSARPVVWYAGLELVIGLWALSLWALIPRFNAAVPTLIGPTPSPLWHWGVSFGSALALLLPATVAMGATLPALQRMFEQRIGERDRVAGLYAANTFGAVLGTLLTTFWLAPVHGYGVAIAVLAALNGVGALAALALTSGGSVVALEGPAQTAPAPRAASPRAGRFRLLSALWLTGLCGIGYEVAMVRTLSQLLADTVYTFAVLLAVYLAGTAIGAAVLQRRLRAGEPASLSRLSAMTALACLFGIACAWTSPSVLLAVAGALADGLGRGVAAGVFAECLVGALVFLAPTVAMGALCSALLRRAAPVVGLGPALAVNTFGAAIAPGLVGLALIPAFGTAVALCGLSLGYVLVLGLDDAAPNTHTRLGLASVPVVAGAILLALATPARFVSLPEGGQLVTHREGVMAAVSVVQGQSGERYLKVNDRFTMGGTASRFSDHRQTHLPLLLHGAARRALYLGLGTGLTFDAARDYPGLMATGVELIPEVLSVLPAFDSDPRERHWQGEPRLLAADARRFVLSDPAHYDVVIAELFHPFTDGAAALYTREHFAAVKARLSEGGLFCQWLPLYQLDDETLRTIVRTFVSAFEHVEAHLGHFSLEQPILALIGRRAPPPGFVPGWLEARVHHRPLQQRLVQLRLNSDFALYGGYLGDRSALARFAGPGPINRDLHPVVAFGSPAVVYGPRQAPVELLLRLVDGTRAARAQVPDDEADADASARSFHRRLLRYWVARDAFLHAGVEVRPTGTLSDMLAQVRGPLLDVVRMSPDFAPAYAPLLGMARDLYRDNPTAARALLTQLAEVQPERPEALALRRSMFGQ